MERRQIVSRLRAGGGRVLVTLVHAEGSSYRQTGARLLLGNGGATAGTISGGCLEGDLVRRAEWMVRDGPVVQHYSTAFDDTEEIPYGLGCGGELDLLLERAESKEAGALLEAMERSLAGEPRRVVTWLPTKGATLRRAVYAAAPEPAGGWNVVYASGGLPAEELRWGGTLPAGDGWPRAFVEELQPPQRLLVLGAGDDARPMVAMAAMLGWSVVVADGRPTLARAESFPGAERVVLLEDGAAALEIRSGDAVVLMTHSYEQDRRLLVEALPGAPRYLGLLGARHRSSLLVSEAAVVLGWTVAACCERLHAPVGLDLGGDGPEAIALAVIAEIQGCVQGRPAMSRRLSAGEVAEQVERGGASQYLQAQCAMGEPR